MKVQCPKCGKEFAVSGLGRKRLNIPFKNISEVLQACQSVELAAGKLRCSVGYIYQELAKKGLKPRDMMGGIGCPRTRDAILERRKA